MALSQCLKRSLLGKKKILNFMHGFKSAILAKMKKGIFSDVQWWKKISTHFSDSKHQECMIFARIGHGPCYYHWNEILAGVRSHAVKLIPTHNFKSIGQFVYNFMYVALWTLVVFFFLRKQQGASNNYVDQILPNSQQLSTPLSSGKNEHFT